MILHAHNIFFALCTAVSSLVDSLSLYPQHPVEKTVKVAFVAEIFRRSSWVLAWLGEEERPG